MSYQEKIPPRVYYLKLSSLKEDVLTLAHGILISLGFSSSEIIQSTSKGQSQIMVYRCESKMIHRAYALFKKLSLQDLHATMALLKPEDWVSKWKKGWKPSRLTKKLDVVPVWHRESYKVKEGRDYILMDTMMSFGTGLHETTRIMSQFIEDKSKQIKTFLDIGTGTGILSLVALKNGAKKILAIDIGELSVEAALKNSQVNNLPFKVKCANIATFKHQHLYDFVAANLITHDLIAFRKHIIRFVKPNGFLAVSGISLDNWKKFEKSFMHSPLKLIKVKKGKQWAGALFQVVSKEKTL